MKIYEGKNAGKHLCSKCWILKSKDQFNKSSSQECGRRSECKDCQKKYWNKRVESGRQKEYKRKYRFLNKSRLNAQRNIRRNNRKRIDISFMLIEKLRNRIRSALTLKNGTKAKSSIILLGCSIKDFRIYLESQFEPGMTWQNYGIAWEIDHIIPCALFDFTKSEHQERCFHFSNHQPLWKEINRKKGSKLFHDRSYLNL